jgi:hypothetical protein
LEIIVGTNVRHLSYEQHIFAVQGYSKDRPLSIAECEQVLMRCDGEMFAKLRSAQEETAKKIGMNLEVKQEKEGVKMIVKTAVESFDSDLLRVDTKIQDRRADNEFGFPGDRFS